LYSYSTKNFFSEFLTEMLSILIPIYNFDVRALVQALQGQCLALEVPFEILGFDDGSDEKCKALHRPMEAWEGVAYREMPENLGRARIRNRLAAAAQYPYLLFMDGDSKVIRPDYIKKYVAHLAPDTLLYGGRSYAIDPPTDPDYFFHWWYGQQREVQPVAVRQAKPYHAFMTNNFLIPKAIFEPIRFDAQLLQYGHEDTLFGLELRRRNIRILHLDNPLEHIGLEPKALFIRKNQKAIENLYLLSGLHPDLKTRLLAVFRQLRQWRLAGVARLLLHGLRPALLQRMDRPCPDLRAFDLYKLLLLLEENHRHAATL
jgi:glycosyltransferase involved in cell wall biosynthesis